MSKLPKSPLAPEWAAENFSQILQRLYPLHAQPDGTLYAEAHGPHFIVVTKSFNRLRLWILDQDQPNSGVVQSEMALDNPLYLVDPYTQAAILGLCWQPTPQRIYCAGLGGGRVPMLFHHYLPTATIDCTEIDPAVIDMATRFFGLGQDERLQVHIADGRGWLEKSAPYDLIFVDVFLDRGYIPYRMSTVEFYQCCRQQLTPGGILVINLLSEDQFLPHRVRTLCEVFPGVAICTLDEGNTLLYASMTPLDLPTLLERAIELQQTHHFTFPLATLALEVKTDLVKAGLDLDDLTPLYDATPPVGYFDSLPVLTELATPVDAALPCPCGSGKPYGQCHGQTPEPSPAP